MLIQLKCPSCPEWHELNGVPSGTLVMFAKMILKLGPLEPFSTAEWLQIIHTELTRRARVGHN